MIKIFMINFVSFSLVRKAIIFNTDRVKKQSISPHHRTLLFLPRETIIGHLRFTKCISAYTGEQFQDFALAGCSARRRKLWKREGKIRSAAQSPDSAYYIARLMQCTYTSAPTASQSKFRSKLALYRLTFVATRPKRTG